MKEKIWQKDVCYTILRAYTNACARTCFRKMKFNGLEKIPAEGALIFASNHCCTMMDPMVLCCKSVEPLSFGARADIFRKPLVAKILRFIKMVPLARPHDGREAVLGNNAVFDEVVDVIEHGVPFCLYPEGTHFPGYELHRLKTGASRIALLAAENYPKPVYIIPTGLIYSDFYDFMADVTINIGDPIEVHKGDTPPEVTAKLTERMTPLIYEPERKPVTGKWWKRILALLSLPLFALCAAASSPILILTAILARNLEDRAWINTVRFGCRYLFFVLWPFHCGFFLLLNFYKKLI
ncbi:MAG: 1-acyl-sn-glycerol-3-phosphate acyltransferase [Bacteroidales bacterium]|nr:1-acyl-sn-glycerol-3-phosphate acyltransferase [Bacteroidales bacterium]